MTALGVRVVIIVIDALIVLNAIGVIPQKIVLTVNFVQNV